MSSSCAFRAAISRTHGHTKHAVHSGASTHPVACDPAGAHRRPCEEYETCNKYVVGGDPNKPCDPTAVDDCKTGDCTATETCDPERYLGNGKCSTLDMRHVAPHASHTPHSPHLCRQVQHARGLPEADGADRADLVLVRDR